MNPTDRFKTALERVAQLATKISTVAAAASASRAAGQPTTRPSGKFIPQIDGWGGGDVHRYPVPRHFAWYAPAMTWVEPMTVDDLLDLVARDWTDAPPESNGVYVVSLRPWQGEPTPACGPLYVGGNTGKSDRFRTRMGDLIADLFGFYGETTAHHSGGVRLNNSCAERGINPKSLHIGWAKDCRCRRCSEGEVYRLLRPELNKATPSGCKDRAGR